MNTRYDIEPLTARHDRAAFACGEPSLNDFLKRYARQNDERGLGRTYVAVIRDEPRIYGYYTIASGAVSFDAIPEKLPRYPIPVLHLGRLAVDEAAQGQRLGNILLLDALRRAVTLAGQVGIYGVEVNALNETAKTFYLKYGFTPLLDDALHLWISLKAIRALGLV